MPRRVVGRRQSLSCDEGEANDVFSNSSEGETAGGRSPRRVPRGGLLTGEDDKDSARGENAEDDLSANSSTKDKLKARYKEWKNKRELKRGGKRKGVGAVAAGRVHGSGQPRIGRRPRRRKDGGASIRRRAGSSKMLWRGSRDDRNSSAARRAARPDAARNFVASDGEHAGILSYDDINSTDESERQQAATRAERLRSKMKERVKDWLDERRERLVEKKRKKRRKMRRRRNEHTRAEEGGASSGAEADINESSDEDNDHVAKSSGFGGGSFNITRASFRAQLRKWARRHGKTQEERGARGTGRSTDGSRSEDGSVVQSSDGGGEAKEYSSADGRDKKTRRGLALAYEQYVEERSIATAPSTGIHNRDEALAGFSAEVNGGADQSSSSLPAILRSPSAGGFQGSKVDGEGEFEFSLEYSSAGSTGAAGSVITGEARLSTSARAREGGLMHTMTAPDGVIQAAATGEGQEAPSLNGDFRYGEYDPEFTRTKAKKKRGLARAKEKWKKWKMEHHRSANGGSGGGRSGGGNDGHGKGSRLRLRRSRVRTSSKYREGSGSEKEEQNGGRGNNNNRKNAGKDDISGVGGESKEDEEDRLDKLTKKMKLWWREKKNAVTTVVDKYERRLDDFKKDFMQLHHRPPGSPRFSILDDRELSRPALVLRSLPANFQKSAICLLWEDASVRAKEKMLRASGNLAVSSVEERLCSLHRRALGAIVQSREPNELLPEHFRVTIPLSRKGKVAHKLKKGLNKHAGGTHARPDDISVSSTTKLMSHKKMKRIMKKGMKGKGSAFYWGLGQHVSDERLLRLVLNCALQDPPPPLSATTPCPACVECGVVAMAGGESPASVSGGGSVIDIGKVSDSDERLASRNYQVLCKLLLVQVRRRIGLQILQFLAVGLESMLLDYNHVDNSNYTRSHSGIVAGNGGAGEGSRKSMLPARSSPIKEIEEAEVAEEHECPVCVDLLAQPCVLRCEHVFCRLCLLKIAQLRVRKYLQPLCPLCRESFKLSDLSVDSITTKELEEAYPMHATGAVGDESTVSGGGRGQPGDHENKRESVGNETIPLAYCKRVQNVAAEERMIMTSLNILMKKRKESDRVPKDRVVSSSAGSYSWRTAFAESGRAIRVFMLIAVASAYCFGTAIFFGVITAVYLGVISHKPKQVVGFAILLGIKLAFPYMALRRL